MPELKIEPIALPAQAWQPERRPWVIDAHLVAASENINAAEAAVSKAREKLAEVEKKKGRKEERSIPASSSEVADLQEELKVAEAAFDVAVAEFMSVERCADAMRATWAVSDNKSAGSKPALAKTKREKTTTAVRAERRVVAAKARHSVVVTELSLLRATGNKKASVEKTLKTARDSLESLGEFVLERAYQYADSSCSS